MATYTITVNERTTTGKAVVEFLRSLGILREKETKKEKEIDLTQKAINEIKEGKGIRCRTFEDYLKEMEK
jgi:hypothetical protein